MAERDYVRRISTGDIYQLGANGDLIIGDIVLDSYQVGVLSIEFEPVVVSPPPKIKKRKKDVTNSVPDNPSPPPPPNRDVITNQPHGLKPHDPPGSM